MAVYNGADWLPKQIESILSQANVSVTLFISIDQSTDDTELQLSKIQSDEPRIKILPMEPRFGSAGKNFFRLLRDVEISHFDYLALADQDDIWLPDKLQRAHEMICANNASGYSSSVTAFWHNGRIKYVNKSKPQTQWDFLFEAAGPGCTYVLSNKLALALQNFIFINWIEVQKITFHDWLLYAFARANNHLWIIDRRPGMLYRQHERNSLGANVGLRAFYYRLVNILNGWYISESSSIARLVGLKTDPFVSRWSNGSRSGILFLASNSFKCRRRVRDKLFFFVSCLLMFIVNPQRK
jgi:rhamnosyltransferase